MIKQTIEQAVKGALLGLGAGEAAFVVERPGQMEHGDYATNAALAAAKALKKNPREVADALAKELQGNVEGVEKIEVAGAGFINFFLSRDAIAQEVEAAATKNEWGNNDLYKGKKVMVEYTDPNPFKEFHIGHLMSNAIGESIARVLENAGADVVRANYQGDVGRHVARAVWGLKKTKEILGDVEKTIALISFAYVFGSAADENIEPNVWYLPRSMQFITNDKEKYFYKCINKEASLEIDQVNKQIFDRSNEEVNEWYDWGRKISLEHFEHIYEVLGMQLRNHYGELKYFDYYFFESMSSPVGKVIVDTNTPSVFEKNDGAIIFRGEKYDPALHTRVFINSQGLPTYEAKELGLLKFKKEKEGLTESITITASEQKDYFKVVLAAAKQIEELKSIAEKTKHITHGMMRFAEGKMSSRKGNVITGETLISTLALDALRINEGRQIGNVENLNQKIAVGAIKYAVLKQGSGKDIVFDPKKSLSLEGDSGPYLQYARVRAMSLLNKNPVPEQVVSYVENQPSPLPLARILIHYPDVLKRAVQELEPHYITTYLTELASAFNTWYGTEHLIIEGKIRPFNLALVQAFERVMSKGLYALGIPAPEKM